MFTTLRSLSPYDLSFGSFGYAAAASSWNGTAIRVTSSRIPSSGMSSRWMQTEPGRSARKSSAAVCAFMQTSSGVSRRWPM